MKRYQVAFDRVPVGETFTQNGNAYEKRSLRTGYLIEYGRTFYFGTRELVTVGQAVADKIKEREA